MSGFPGQGDQVETFSKRYREGAENALYVSKNEDKAVKSKFLL
jgi:hypothetical protein